MSRAKPRAHSKLAQRSSASARMQPLNPAFFFLEVRYHSRPHLPAITHNRPQPPAATRSRPHRADTSRKAGGEASAGSYACGERMRASRLHLLGVRLMMG